MIDYLTCYFVAGFCFLTFCWGFAEQGDQEEQVKRCWILLVLFWPVLSIAKFGNIVGEFVRK